MIQNTVFILSLILMGVVLACFLYVALFASSEGSTYSRIQARAYNYRSLLFWILLVVSVITTIITTQDLPYAASRNSLANVDKQIDVTGGQWYWQLSDSVAKVGDTVVFNVNSVDVTRQAIQMH